MTRKEMTSPQCEGCHRNQQYKSASLFFPFLLLMILFFYINVDEVFASDSWNRTHLTCGVDVLVMRRATILLVILLLSVVVISSVQVFTVYVVIVVRVSGVPLCVTGAGMVSAPFASVCGRDADVDGLRLCQTERGAFNTLYRLGLRFCCILLQSFTECIKDYRW